VEVTVELRYLPCSLGARRFLGLVEQVRAQMEGMGVEEKEVEQILSLFSPDRIYELCLFYTVALLHIVFASLAFKNEIGFWSERRDMVGLSRRTVVGSAVCSVIVFLYLLDKSGTSLLVSGTAGFGALVDLWKVVRAHRVGRAEKSSAATRAEERTEGLDATGMRYLSYVLYPLVAGWAVYSLVTRAHRSWWSWLIESAANGVYAFGFLMMMPQIFINYKLKSVAHLPWRAMMYKVFNTFVDDIFAWLVHMPTMHRLATLRDDLVFFIYLYQRWIYPVDKTRPNEYGFITEPPTSGEPDSGNTSTNLAKAKED